MFPSLSKGADHPTVAKAFTNRFLSLTNMHDVHVFLYDVLLF